MECYVILIIHHSGQIVEDEYIGGEDDVWDYIDVDKISLPTIEQLLKEHDELQWEEIYYVVPGQTLKEGLRKLSGDQDIHQLFADIKGCEEIHLYVTHQHQNVEEADLHDSSQQEEDDDYDSGEDSLFRLGRQELQQEEEDVFLECNEVDEENTRVEKGPKKRVRNTTTRFQPKTQNERAEQVAQRHVEDAQIAIEDVKQFAAYDTDEDHSWKGSDLEDEEDNVFPQFNLEAEFGEVALELGMEFPSIKVFIKAVKDFNIHLGREVKWHLHDTRRAQAKCKGEGCPWEIYCSINTKTNTFQVKRYNFNHKCCRQFKNKQADKAWVANNLVPEVRAYPKLTGQQAYDHMMVHYKVSVPDATIFRALKVAHAIVQGSEKEQYAKMWDYGQELLRSNPGSTILLWGERPFIEKPPTFDRFYVCLDACKSGFLAGCRPLVGLDGCHLKGYYGGILLSAVAQDGNNGFYVIAYAIVGSETKDTWAWFLTLLLQDLGEPHALGLEFISDQQKGLLPAMSQFMPGVPHRYCARHLWENIAKQWRGKELRDLFWKTCKCTTEQQFEKNMETMKKVNEEAWKWVNKLPKANWSRSHFSTRTKNQSVVNNACEQFNSAIVKCRSKPIITMAEEIRLYLMKRLTTTRAMMKRYKGPLCPRVQTKLEKAKIDSVHWTPIWVGDPDGCKFEVECKPTKVAVDLKNSTCSCRVWDLRGIPCQHALAALCYNNWDAEKFVHPWLSRELFESVHKSYINPISGEKYWAKTNKEPLLPPTIKRPTGRPKLKRKKAPDEAQDPYKLRRSYGEITCGKCKGKGHNSRSCKAAPTQQVKKRSHTCAAQVGQSSQRNETSEQAVSLPEDHTMQQEQNMRRAHGVEEANLPGGIQPTTFTSTSQQCVTRSQSRRAASSGLAKTFVGSFNLSQESVTRKNT